MLLTAKSSKPDPPLFVCMQLLLWFVPAEALSWTHCGHLELPNGHTVTTTTPWLKILPLSPGRHNTLQLQCSCPAAHPQGTAAHLLLIGPEESRELKLTMLGRCRKVGCWWNSVEYLTLSPGATLEGGGLFEHSSDGVMRIRSGIRHNGWLNITLSVNITKKLLINVTHTLPFDAASCSRAAKDTTRALSVAPLLYLAGQVNDIHDGLVDTPVLFSPTTNQMSHDLIRTVRQVTNTPPRFNTLFYFETLEENNEPGVTVATVVANDPDPGSNGHVTYSLVANGDESVLSLFEINPELGVITVTGKPPASYTYILATQCA